MARTLPSSSIWAESLSLEPMSPTGVDPPPPYKKQKLPDSLVANYKPWPLTPLVREFRAASLASILSSPRFGFMRIEEAEVITKKFEDEAYKAADAAPDISLEERKSMYKDLMFTLIGKYRLSESEFSAKLDSDPRYKVNWSDIRYCDPGLPWDSALWKPQIDQAQPRSLYAEWLAYQDSGTSSHESLEAIQVISSEQAQLQTPHAPSCVITTSSQQRQDSGMSSHESLEDIQAILSDKGKLGQVLLQHPNLLKALQEKLEQQ